MALGHMRGNLQGLRAGPYQTYIAVVLLSQSSLHGLIGDILHLCCDLSHLRPWLDSACMLLTTQKQLSIGVELAGIMEHQLGATTHSSSCLVSFASRISHCSTLDHITWHGNPAAASALGIWSGLTYMATTGTQAGSQCHVFGLYVQSLLC